jgi:hypothetical protein
MDRISRTGRLSNIDIAARRCRSGRPTEDDLAQNEGVALIRRVTPNMDHIKLDPAPIRKIAAQLISAPADPAKLHRGVFC